MRAITINPALQIGIADKCGSIEKGKKADMVILNLDPRTVSPEELTTIKVEKTWFEGRVVFDSTAV